MRLKYNNKTNENIHKFLTLWFIKPVAYSVAFIATELDSTGNYILLKYFFYIVPIIIEGINAYIEKTSGRILDGGNLSDRKF